MLGAFVKRHDDVCAQPDLRLHCAFWCKKMGRAIQVRTKPYAFFRHLTQLVQTEDLESARVGQNGARPRHETVQPTQLAHLLHSRPQVKMVGIPQKNLHSQFLQDVLRNALYRRQRSHRHEHGRLHHPMGSSQPPDPRRSAGCFDLKGD